MKRLFVLGLAVLAFGASTFASDNKTVTEKLNNKVTQQAVARYLDTDYQQTAHLEYIFSEASKRHNKAIAKGASTEEAAKIALNFNLANARVVLSTEQYKKFLSVLNVTLMNASNYALFAEK